MTLAAVVRVLARQAGPFEGGVVAQTATETPVPTPPVAPLTLALVFGGIAFAGIVGVIIAWQVTDLAGEGDEAGDADGADSDADGADSDAEAVDPEIKNDGES